MAKGTPNPDRETERRFEVLLERIESQVRAVAEGHGLLVKELRETRQMLEKRLEFLEKATMEGFGKVWEAQQQTNRRLDELVGKLDAHERAHVG